MLRSNFPIRAKLRKESSLKRQEEASKLTPAQKLAELDKHGFVAAKEQAKLNKKVEQ
jgi:hypothetical protein